ncbi:hypothetical protein [Methylobacterium sp. Leaf108]|uniref:hypothetical protein n=1 Tax=Methylobacterium sp. Leaf108 TaxID=1736256 RepID=UPI000AB410B6|nr:hypothetical protein [Methylobacterium sp. Leaf108]
MKPIVFALAVRLGLSLVPILSVAGCQDYLARRDTLTLDTGEAVQTNMAIHVLDPTPEAAGQFDREMNGERLQRGIERYRNPQSGLGGFGTPAAVPLGAPSGGSPPTR